MIIPGNIEHHQTATEAHPLYLGDVDGRALFEIAGTVLELLTACKLR